MMTTIKKFLSRLRRGDHPWLPWHTIGRSDDIYLTRVYLTPRTKWGQGLFHIFHRGDGDPDPHDHPWAFWTFPFNTYEEEVLEYIEGKLILVVHRVDAWKWHYRPATHIHRVLGAVHPYGYRLAPPFFTIVWTTSWKRPWGFWPQFKLFGSSGRLFVPWRKYLALQKEAAPLEYNWNMVLEKSEDPQIKYSTEYAFWRVPKE